MNVFGFSFGWFPSWGWRVQCSILTEDVEDVTDVKDVDVWLGMARHGMGWCGDIF